MDEISAKLQEGSWKRRMREEEEEEQKGRGEEDEEVTYKWPTGR